MALRPVIRQTNCSFKAPSEQSRGATVVTNLPNGDLLYAEKEIGSLSSLKRR